MPAEDEDLQRRAGLPNQFSNPFANLTTQNGFTIFVNPHQVAFQVGGRSTAIMKISVSAARIRGVENGRKRDVFVITLAFSERIFKCYFPIPKPVPPAEAEG